MFSFTGSIAGQTTYARHVIDTLTSPAFWGRGYTANGMSKAANYLAQQFDSLGLQPVGEHYLQHFSYSANSFAGSMYVSVNDKVLRPGVDFIVSPESRGFTGTAQFTGQDSAHFFDPVSRVLLHLQPKLTWSVAGNQADYTLILLNEAAVAGIPKKAVIKIDNAFLPVFEAANVCGKITGTTYPDSLLVVCAHYDHLGGMGNKTFFPGANDNASGTALLLDLAAYYAKHPAPFTMVFIAFAGEEAGLKGSEYFVNHPLVDLKNIRFLLNLDLEGNGSEGATVVNATEYANEFSLLQAINTRKNYLPAINARGKAANSDHSWFSEKGVPAFFIYTLGGSKAYHDIFDVPANLTLNKYNNLFNLLTDFLGSIAHQH